VAEVAQAIKASAETAELVEAAVALLAQHSAAEDIITATVAAVAVLVLGHKHQVVTQEQTLVAVEVVDLTITPTTMAVMADQVL
jgi:hypothetical protein